MKIRTLRYRRMEIDKKQIIGRESEIAKLRREILTFNKTGLNNYRIIETDDLLNNYNHDWNKIKAIFAEDYRKYEHLLFRLHYKRKQNITEEQRKNIILFLAIGYLFSSDVRYFNEFLYFYRKNSSFNQYMLLLQDAFYKNLTATGHHCFPICEISEIEEYIKNTEHLSELAAKGNSDQALRIGLFGSPTFFKGIRSELLRRSFDVRCFFIPYHPDKKIRFVLKNKAAFRLLCLLKKVDFGFCRINHDYKDSKIYEILKKEDLDIGFHKLGFIIKKNIIDALKIGLINDHWAVLPYIRGRSTIEYSLLFGIPVAATTHFVDYGVDSGDIIKIYRVAMKEKHATIGRIRNQVRSEMAARAIDSIEVLSKTKKATVSNESGKGLMFYSIHPLLTDYIESNILRRNG